MSKQQVGAHIKKKKDSQNYFPTIQRESIENTVCTVILPFPIYIRVLKISFKARKSGQHKHANTFMSQKYYDRGWLPNNPTFFSMSTPASEKSENN